MNRSIVLVLTAAVILVASVINYQVQTVDQTVVVIAAGVGLVCLVAAALSSRFVRTRLAKRSAFSTGDVIGLAVAVLIGVLFGHVICQFAYPSASARFR